MIRAEAQTNLIRVNDGQDGTTPIITTSKTGNTTTIYANGVSIGTVVDGSDGSTPNITATKTGNTTTISANGTVIATINDGTSVTVSSVTKVGKDTTLVMSDGTVLTISDGTDGNNGTNGSNGYVHIAWANSADGSVDFSTSVSTGKSYLGSYTDNTLADSQTYSDYNWSLIRGPQGDDGVSAYDAAVEGGYSGTESEFNTELADVPNKANQEEIDKIVYVGGTDDNLLINTDVNDTWADDLLQYTDEPVLSIGNWSIFNDDANEECVYIASTSTHIIEHGREEILFGISAEWYGEEEEEEPEDGDVRYCNSGIYQDIELEANTNYIFSVFSETYGEPLIDCKALDSNDEVISNTGWDSKDFTWSRAVNTYDSDYIRVYKTFNTGNYTTWRFRVYAKNTWYDDWQGLGWSASWYDEPSYVNHFQLVKGTTLTRYVSGYWSLNMVRASIESLIKDCDQLESLQNAKAILLQKTQRDLYGLGNNILKNTTWTFDTKFTKADPTNLSLGKWSVDDTPINETWNGEMSKSYAYSYNPNYQSFSQTPNEYYQFLRPDYNYSYSGATPAAGDTTLLEGGIYQDVELTPNKNYTFSLLLYNHTSSSGGAFVDCKALTQNNSTYSTVPNTGFDIQEWPYYQGTKDWTVTEHGNLGVSTIKVVYITFNSGSYSNYRFRIYGAQVYADSSTIYKYGNINKFYLVQGNNVPYVDIWYQFGKEYSLASLYTQCNNMIDMFYPVGSYYETSDTSFNPNTEWGGIWELETAGQVHVSGASSGTYQVSGALTNTSDGGAATVTLTSAQSGVPAHSHPYTDANTTYTAKTASRKPGTSTAVSYQTGLTAGGGTSNKTTSNNTAADATTAHENMPPYIVVYRWHRTA